MNDHVVIIHAAGNIDIGIGNLTRCYELLLALHNMASLKIEVIFECNENIFDFINTHRLNINRFDTRDESKKHLEGLSRCNAKYIYISDIVDMTYDMEVFVRKIGKIKIAHLNDSGLSVFTPDILIDGDIFRKKWHLKNTEILQSPKFHIIKNNILEYRPDHSWNNDSVKNIAVCFSGSDPSGYTEKLLDELQGYNGNLCFNFILGPGFTKERVNNAKNKKNININIIVNEKNMAEVILKNDILVSLGGGIVYEAMFLGRPSLGIGWRGLEYYIDEMEKFGVIKKINSNKMLEELEKYSNELQLLKDIANKGWQYIDGKGAVRVVEYLINKFN